MKTPLSPAEDPELTAYALGELEGTERTAVEERRRTDPAAREVVESIRATARQIESALAAEALPATAPAVRPKRRRPWARMLRFPELYYGAATLAAACVAVLVVMRQPEAQQGVEWAAKKVEPRREQTVAPVPVPTEFHMHLNEADDAANAAPPAFASQLPPPPTVSAGVDKLAKDVQRVRIDAPASAAASLKEEAKMKAATFGQVMAARKVSATTELERAYAIQRARQLSLGGEREMSTEAYAYQAESGFLDARQNPLSTFSIDVDTASYANVRRFLNMGRRPPVDAVRIEELVNYFPYHYPAPTDGSPFAVALEVASAPWASGHRLVRIGVKGREVAMAERPAANLVFLLDVSGSMSAPNKLPLVKESLRILVHRLRADDRVAIVTYAGNSGLALASTPVRKAAEILRAVDELNPGGSTNGAMGIQLAYDVAKANFVPGGLNRVILCTDGDFNVGTTSEGELTRLIEEKAKSGVFLTVLGFGMGNYKDSTLERLADKGNGNYGYIDSRREAEKLLAAQANGTLVTIAKDVKIQVEFNPAQVAAYRLIGYENRRLAKEDFNNDAVDAGEIGAGHTVTALYEIIPAGAEMPAAGSVDALKYQRPASTNANEGRSELLTVKIRSKEPAGDVSTKHEYPLTDAGKPFTAASSDFNFAAAVAGFGMILRESSYKGSATFADVTAWAQAGLADDVGGYRGEFVRLVKQAEAIQP